MEGGASESQGECETWYQLESRTWNHVWEVDFVNQRAQCICFGYINSYAVPCDESLCSGLLKKVWSVVDF